jgi:hypothetical protein
MTLQEVAVGLQLASSSIPLAVHTLGFTARPDGTALKSRRVLVY